MVSTTETDTQGNSLQRAAAGGASKFSKQDVIVGLLCAFSILGFLGRREIDGVRERRLAGSASDIDRNGHWLVPSLHGEPRFLKPPLSDWCAAASMRLLGRSEFSFRLPFALFGLGLVALSYALGRQLMSPAIGRMAALILGSTLWYVTECHGACTDLLLSFFCGSAMLGWLYWQKIGQPWSPSWWCFYLSLGLAVLSKGPVALAIVLIPIVLELWVSGRWSLARCMHLECGMLLVVAPVAIWVLGVCMSVDDAPSRWLADMKFSLNNKDQATMLGHLSHLAHWLWLCFPWSVPGALALGLPLFRRRIGAWSQVRICYFWAAGGLVFFSTWAMQPIHYLMPLAIPLAILEAVLCQHALEVFRMGQAQEAVRRLGVLNSLTFLALPVLTAVLMHCRAAASLPLAITAGLMLALPAALAMWWVRSRPRQAFTLCVATGVLCLAVSSGWIQPENSRRESIVPFARKLATIVPETEPVYFQKMEDSMPFYSNRDFHKIALPDERADRDQELPSIDHGYLVLSRQRYDDAIDSLGSRFRTELLVDGQDQSETEPNKRWILMRLSPLLTSRRIEQNPR